MSGQVPTNQPIVTFHSYSCPLPQTSSPALRLLSPDDLSDGMPSPLVTRVSRTVHLIDSAVSKRPHEGDLQNPEDVDMAPAEPLAKRCRILPHSAETPSSHFDGAFQSK